MKSRIFRAPILNPHGPEQLDVWADGAVRIKAGRIEAVGDFSAIVQSGDVDVETLDGVIIPGFIDVHTHWVQYRVRGVEKRGLMPWLSQTIWPEEARYGDAEFAKTAASQFFADEVSAGTVAGMAYSSVHEVALRVASAERLGDWMIGDVVMDHGAPEALVRESVQTIDALDGRALAVGEHYVVTPRFALSCSAGLMAKMGSYARARGRFVQTHLSESSAEISLVRKTFPAAENYTDVYDRAGLLGPRTILGHCVHLSAREWTVLGNRRCSIAHCPSSNEALDSGRMDLETARQNNVHYALASDVGAGPSHSLLHVMQRFLAVHRKAGVRITAREALYRATLGGAVCMGKEAIAGNLQAGKRADFLLMPAPGGSMASDGWIEDWVSGSMRELESRPCATWIAGQRYG